MFFDIQNLVNGAYFSVLIGSILVVPAIFLKEMYLIISTPVEQLDSTLLKKRKKIDKYFPELSVEPFFSSLFLLLSGLSKQLSLIFLVFLVVFFSVGTFFIPMEMRHVINTLPQYFDYWSLFPAWIPLLLFAVWIISFVSLVTSTIVKFLRLQKFYENFKEDYLYLKQTNEELSKQNELKDKIISNLEKKVENVKLVATVIQNSEFVDIDFRKRYELVVWAVRRYGDKGYAKVNRLVGRKINNR